MKVIGVTGGIGAGKTTVLEILQKKYKAGIFPADEIGKKLMEPGAACFWPVMEAFGETVLAADGRLDRGKIAEMVFGNREALNRLNGIIHPAVRTEIEGRLKGMEEEERLSAREFCPDREKIAVIESAILLEAGYGDICKEIWYVYASEETRISRLMETRGYSRKRCLEIMGNQMEEVEFRARATAIVENEGPVEQVEEQVKRLLAK